MKEFPADFLELNEFYQMAAISDDIDVLMAAGALAAEEQLSKDVQEYFAFRLKTMQKVSDLEAEKNNADRKEIQPPEIIEDGRSRALNIDKEGIQTTGNGCWSVSMGILLRSQGVDLTQQEIRAFRPSFSQEEAEQIIREGKDHAADPKDYFTECDWQVMNEDRMGNVFDYSDLIMRTVPNTCVRDITYRPVTDQNRENVIDDIFAVAASAIYEHHQPVSILIGGHYRTILGIDDNTKMLKIADSQKEGKPEYVSADELIRNSDRVELTWLQKLNITNEGRVEGLPESFKGLSYVKGRLVPGDGYSEEGSILQTKGKALSSHALFNHRMEGMANRQERIVAPKELVIPEVIREKQQDLPGQPNPAQGAKVETEADDPQRKADHLVQEIFDNITSGEIYMQMAEFAMAHNIPALLMPTYGSDFDRKLSVFLAQFADRDPNLGGEKAFTDLTVQLTDLIAAGRTENRPELQEILASVENAEKEFFNARMEAEKIRIDIEEYERKQNEPGFNGFSMEQRDLQLAMALNSGDGSVKNAMRKIRKEEAPNMPHFKSNVMLNADVWLEVLAGLRSADKNAIPEFDNLVLALKELKARTGEEYAKKGRDKQMTDASYESLSNAYRKAGVLLENYFQKEGAKNKGTSDLLEEIRSEIAQDMNSLDRYKESKEIVSFQTLIDRGYVPEIDLGSAKVTQLGGKMSKRWAFRFRQPDGRDMNGVFTQKTEFKPSRIEEEDRQNIRNIHVQALAVFADAYAAYRQSANLPDNARTLKKFYKDAASRKTGSFVRMMNDFYGDIPEYAEKKNLLQSLVKENAEAFEEEAVTYQHKCRELAGKDPVPADGTLIGELAEDYAFTEEVLSTGYKAWLSELKEKRADNTTSRYIYYCQYQLKAGQEPDDRKKLKFLSDVVTYYKKHDCADKARKISQMNFLHSKEFGRKFERFCRKVCDWRNRIGVNIGAGIFGTNRIDTRNIGMSIVAGMLGRPELVAHAIPLSIRYGDRKYEGTFMAMGKGTDMTRMKDEPELKEYTSENFQTDGLRDMSDLMVIDYICGNTDRHAANQLYRFNKAGLETEQHRFTGIQGIDNDCSFGSFDGTKTNLNANTRFPFLDRIQVISESMADKIIHLDERELGFRLRGLGLKESQIEAAKKRLGNLKSAVLEGNQYYNSQEYRQRYGQRGKTLVQGKIYAVRDAELKKIPLNVLSDADQSYFTVLNTFSGLIGEKDLEKGALKLNAVNNVYRNSVSSEEIAQIKRRMEEMNRATVNNKTSNEFTQLYNALDTYSKFCEPRENMMLTPEEWHEKAMQLSNINMRVIAYLKHKQDEFWTTSYAQKRIDLVTEIGCQFREFYVDAAVNVKSAGTPEAQKQITEQIEGYNARRLELLETRNGEPEEPVFRVEINQPGLQPGNRDKTEVEDKHMDAGQKLLI